MTRHQRIGVFGAGAWGLALADAALRAGREVAISGRDAKALAELARTRIGARLPDVRLDPRISVVERLRDVDAALLVVPAQVSGDAAKHLCETLPAEAPIICCAKGIVADADLFVTDAVAPWVGARKLAALSGPSFAADVAKGLPTAVTLAARELSLAQELAQALAGPNFRLYPSDDLRGVEIGGAAKNVLAIACGVAEGLGLGASARAAIVARGFAELARFGEAYGARTRTLMGLSGLGDLVLTCESGQSRNFAFGLALGRGAPLGDVLSGKLAEGAFTAPALMRLARIRSVDMPIAAAVEALVEGRLAPRDAVDMLLARPRRDVE